VSARRFGAVVLFNEAYLKGVEKLGL